MSESVKQQMAKLDLQDLRYWNGQIQNIKKKKKELFKLEKQKCGQEKQANMKVNTQTQK